MLNEFVYCPRLLYLEWVEGLWKENADTVAGGLAHGRSDRGGGRMPASLDRDEPWTGAARSVTLDAPTLGIVANIDLVEAEDGTVAPIDHKKGRPRDDGKPWEPELMQIAAQVLVLRENGYRCDRGYLSFRETRTRVAVQLDEALEQEVLKRLRQIRRVAARDRPPLPLVDSPKCPRCSLVGICFPDETNELRAAVGRRKLPRRLIASRTHAVPLYAQEPGAAVRLAGGRIEVRRDGSTLASARKIDVSEVAIFGGASISEPALRELASAGVPITHFSFGGWFKAMTVGLETNKHRAPHRAVSACRRSRRRARACTKVRRREDSERPDSPSPQWAWPSRPGTARAPAPCALGGSVTERGAAPRTRGRGRPRVLPGIGRSPRT